MDGLPRNGDWQTKEAEGELSVYRHADFRNLITIIGPDRETNARLFMLENELVEAVEKARGLASSLRYRANTEIERNEASHFLNFFNDILAKMKGDAK